MIHTCDSIYIKCKKQAKLIYATGSSHDDSLRGVIKRELKEGAGDIPWSESWCIHFLKMCQAVYLRALICMYIIPQKKF